MNWLVANEEGRADVAEMGLDFDRIKLRKAVEAASSLKMKRKHNSYEFIDFELQTA